MMFYIYWVRLCLVNDAKIFFSFHHLDAQSVYNLCCKKHVYKWKKQRDHIQNPEEHQTVFLKDRKYE